MTAILEAIKELSPYLSIGAAGLSILSLVISQRRLTAAQDNNIIAISAPWAQLLTQQIADEVRNTITDRELFRRVYCVPFTTAAEKTERRNQLFASREKAAGTMQFLSAMASDEAMAALVQARNALEKVEDSFFYSEQLSLEIKAQERLTEDYRKHYEDYLRQVRTFAQNINGSVSARAVAKQKKN